MYLKVPSSVSVIQLWTGKGWREMGQMEADLTQNAILVGMTRWAKGPASMLCSSITIIEWF